MKVFFSHAYDGLSDETIMDTHKHIHQRFTELGVVLANPLMESVTRNTLEKYKIVDKELEQIGLSDVLLADLSIPNWPYIGCICEIVHAYRCGIPIIVYIGENELSARLWLQYHSTYICKTQNEALDYLEGLLYQANGIENGK